MTKPTPKAFSIIDDNGLLALVDTGAYAAFVGADWTYEGLLAHFSKEMARRTILVWECGDAGNEYRIQVRQGLTAEPGFLEMVGTIRATRGVLHLASYSALTMAAQFDDYVVPAKGEADLALDTPTGDLSIRLVQMYDPVDLNGVAGDAPHFILEIEPGEGMPWREVAWESAIDAATQAPMPASLESHTPERRGLLGRIAALFS